MRSGQSQIRWRRFKISNQRFQANKNTFHTCKRYGRCFALVASHRPADCLCCSCVSAKTIIDLQEIESLKNIVLPPGTVVIGEILRTLCEWKKVKIIEAEACPDYIHILVEISSKVAESSFMECLKGKSSLMIYDKFPELRYKYRN